MEKCKHTITETTRMTQMVDGKVVVLGTAVICAECLQIVKWEKTVGKEWYIDGK